MRIEIPEGFDKVSQEVFEDFIEATNHRRVSYSNAIEYRGIQARGEILGYRTNRGDYYLQPRILIE